MALIKCSDCNKIIAKNASYCVHCGSRINSLGDLRMLYQALIEDIKYTKDRQWTITYYLLLLYSALIALDVQFNIIFFLGWKIFLKSVFGIVGGLILWFGINYLNGLINTIKKYRRQLWTDVLPKLTIYDSQIGTLKYKYKDKIKKIRKKCKKSKDESLKDEDYIEYNIDVPDSRIEVFIGILIVAFFFMLLFIFRDFIPWEDYTQCPGLRIFV